MKHIKHQHHGESKTRLYRIWCNLKNRVQPNSAKSKYYYDRGIGLCEEWKNSFESFKDWSINNGYNDKLTLDRINNDGNYCPDNCRWADMKTQANNRSNNIIVCADKESIPLSEICRVLNVDYKTAYNKFVRHLDMEDNVERIGKDCIVFKSIPRLLDMLEPTDRVKWYADKLADALEKEGYSTDAKIVRESIKTMNGEKVAMATMDKKPETSVWHDANILPDNPDEIVIEHGEYGTSIIPACMMSRPKGSKWAYIKDILKL